MHLVVQPLLAAGYGGLSPVQPRRYITGRRLNSQNPIFLYQHRAVLLSDSVIILDRLPTAEKSLIARISGEVDNGLKAVINPKPAACHAIGPEKQNPSLVSNAADNKSNMA
ncbi:MAG: hypothetical protein WBI09_05170 [Methanothrix sp.]